jgi:transposase
MPEAGWKKMTPDEMRLATAWYKDGISPAAIAHRFGRAKSNITRLLVQQKARKRQGAPVKLSKGKVDFLVKRLNELVVKANCKYTVTVDDLKRNTRVKVSTRTILKALHDRGIFFRKLRENRY